MVTVSYKNNTYVCKCSYDDRIIAKQAGFEWNAETKEWCSTTPRAAVKLRKHADQSAKNQLERLLIKREPWTSPLLYPPDETPYPFQLEGVRFALERNKSYLAFDPGLGKTPMAVMVRNSLNIPTLFICPPFLARNTTIEFERWSTAHTFAAVAPDSQITKPKTIEGIKTEFSKFSQALLIVDEAHRFKNPKAKRTKALFEQIAPLFSHQVYLSGTPMPNRPIELYPVLSHAAPETIEFMDELDYGKVFCDAKYNIAACPKCHGSQLRFCNYCRGRGEFTRGWDLTGGSEESVKRLYEKISPTFMMRVKKSEVLKELPPKTEQMIILGDAPAKLLKLDQKILREHSPEDLVKGDLSSEAQESLAVYRHELGNYKVIQSAEYIRELLEDSGESLVVFAYHKDVIAKLEAILMDFNPLVITGAVDHITRHERVGMFQEGRSRLFIANYQAAGIGLTLTKASRVVFVEFSFVPADNDQAGDRVHRIGQLGNVFIQYLVFENSLDRKVLDVCFRKKRLTNQL